MLVVGRFRIALEALTALLNVAFARRIGDGVRPTSIVLGWVGGLGYRVVEGRYVGRFRDRPLRYLVFLTIWSAIVWAALIPNDDSTDHSLAAGIGAGSVTYRIVARMRES
ncbi:hypothetical protein [Halopiger goleimassiliensis]|uniref:hypothetical protein n=1 Tax=Halopiger goleimassiliensis TaxID=1293048 RepID=UPI00067787F5|nr:hypothetical protein [Halopiger goleimassiliensis]